MSILSKKKTSTLWILLVQGGSYSYKVELTFTIDLYIHILLFVLFPPEKQTQMAARIDYILRAYYNKLITIIKEDYDEE